jgi:hypothetical protein
MRISTIILNGNDYKLMKPIDIIEEDYITSGGKRMIKLYNEVFGILGYCTELEPAKKCIEDEVNLIINSYLFEPKYIHDKPMLNGCLVLKTAIMDHVYGTREIA